MGTEASRAGSSPARRRCRRWACGRRGSPPRPAATSSRLPAGRTSPSSSSENEKASRVRGRGELTRPSPRWLPSLQKQLLHLAPTVAAVQSRAMTDYTHINLKDDVEDQAPNFGLSPNLEARMARVPLGLENSGLSYLRMAPGFRIPFGHKHKQQEEVYVLVNGSARIKIEDEVRELKQWDAVRLHRATVRG